MQTIHQTVGRAFLNIYVRRVLLRCSPILQSITMCENVRVQQSVRWCWCVQRSIIIIIIRPAVSVLRSSHCFRSSGAAATDSGQTAASNDRSKPVRNPIKIYFGDVFRDPGSGSGTLSYIRPLVLCAPWEKLLTACERQMAKD